MSYDRGSGCGCQADGRLIRLRVVYPGRKTLSATLLHPNRHRDDHGSPAVTPHLEAQHARSLRRELEVVGLADTHRLPGRAIRPGGGREVKPVFCDWPPALDH